MPSYVYNPGSSGVGGYVGASDDPTAQNLSPLGALGLVEYGGIRIHDGTFVLEGLGGITDTPDTRQTLTDKGGDHGAFIAGSFYGPRYATVEGYVLTEHLDQLWPAIDQLRGAFGLPGAQILRRMDVLMPGWTERRFMMVRPAGPLVVEQLGGSESRKPFRRFQATVVAPDPRMYSATEQVLESTLGAQIGVQNLGNFNAHMVWEVDGPATNPRLNADGLARRIAVDTTVPSGQTLRVDTLTRTVLINGGNFYRTVSRFDDLTARGSEITPYNTSGGSSPTRLIYRHTWI